MRTLEIGGHVISDDAPCYVIAELGANHGGDIAVANALIRAAADAGASAVKLQTRANRTLYTRALYDAPYAHEHSYGATYGAHREALEFGRGHYFACQDLARGYNVAFFSTAFDETSVDVLMGVDVPALKLASGALTDHTLIRYAASFGRPLILSTGGGTEDDIAAAVRVVGCRAPLALLHCTASYPLKAAEANLRCIPRLRALYPDLVIGWSSHAPGIALSLVAYALGARIIEHHVTLDRAGKGTDHGFSLEPKGLRTLCEDLGQARAALGDGVKRWYESERGPIAKMRRQMTPEGLRITGRLA